MTGCKPYNSITLGTYRSKHYFCTCLFGLNT
nr:MAG TPA: hypothetical protein [Caudoviricetes sp.]